MTDSDETFIRSVNAKAARKLAAQRGGPPTAWFGLGMIGVVGWSVAVPTVGGALLGAWIDRRWNGNHSWTLPLLIAGLVLGCANAWSWISRQSATVEGRDGSHD